MNRLTAVGLALFCFSAILQAVEELETYQSPAWDSMQLEATPTRINLPFKNDPARATIELFAVPDRLTPQVKARLEPDCLVFDSHEVKAETETAVQLRILGFDEKTITGRDYVLYIDAQGAVGTYANFYYEGRTAAGKHYWKRLKVRFSGRRMTYAFDQTVPTDLQEFHLRLDFFTPGEFRLYGVRLEKEKDEDVPQNPEPELIFHVPFDGSIEPVLAAGSKAPTRAEKITFDSGISGQAAHFGRSLETELEYSLEKNLDPKCGSIAVWLKLDGNALVDGHPVETKDWQTILSMPWDFATRPGSGAIWFWIYNGMFRADVSDLRDQYIMAPKAGNNEWQHVVFTWDAYESLIYVNGICSKRAGDSASMAQIVRPRRFCRLAADTFEVGNLHGNSLEGWMDDLRIYSGPLSGEDVEKLYRQYQPICLELGGRYFMDGKTFDLTGTVLSSSSAQQTVSVSLEDKAGSTLASTAGLAVKQGTPAGWTMTVPALTPGEYYVVGKAKTSADSAQRTKVPIWIFDSRNREISSDADLKLNLLETIDLVTIAKDRFVNVGDLSIGEFNGRKYIQTGETAGERFAIHFTLPEEHGLYCLEWDFPDDRKRTVDIIAHSALGESGEYELQTGYLIGDEYPSSGTMRTQRCLYWNRSKDIALVFMSARPGGAAAAEVRVYEVEGGLPVAKIQDAQPIGGWTRPLGIYFEDPAINYDFGYDSGLMPEFETMLDRLSAYMKYSGQNMLAYPVVWYSGMIGPTYMPRVHAPEFMDAILTEFDEEGLEFMGTINQNNMPEPSVRVTRKALDEGTLYDSEFTIHNVGTPHPGGWHGSPPNFNPMHPAARKMALEYFDRILAVGAGHPSFKGIILHLPRHAMHSFGDLAAGYNDYMIEGFEKATGLKVDVDRTDPLRGKLYYEWLMANAKEQWIDYRCRILADWYKVLAKRLRDARPDLKLGVNCMIPPFYEASRYDGEGVQDIIGSLDREAGIDPKYYTDCPNIFLEQTLFPADYRWSETRKEEIIRRNMRDIEERAGTYETLVGAIGPWVHQHDRYWESAIGREAFRDGKPNKLEAPWLKEHSWRVSTLNPIGFLCMKPYIMPLRHMDVLGMSKGGFLIGTYGMEEWLRPFAAAYRALPAESFADVAGSSEMVKVRELTKSDGTWFYVVNTSEQPVMVTLTLVADKVTDLAKQEKFQTDGGTLRLTLEPYQLRSFAVDKAGRIMVKSILP